MTTDILDEQKSTLHDSSKERVIHSPSATTTKSVLNTPLNSRRTKYSTETLSSNRSSSHHRSTDFVSFLRSVVSRPFRTTSMAEALAGGQTSDVIGGAGPSSETPVNLIRIRQLNDQNSYSLSTQVSSFLL